MKLNQFLYYAFEVSLFASFFVILYLGIFKAISFIYFLIYSNQNFEVEISLTSFITIILAYLLFSRYEKIRKENQYFKEALYILKIYDEEVLNKIKVNIWDEELHLNKKINTSALLSFKNELNLYKIKSILDNDMFYRKVDRFTNVKRYIEEIEDFELFKFSDQIDSILKKNVSKNMLKQNKELFFQVKADVLVLINNSLNNNSLPFIESKNDEYNEVTELKKKILNEIYKENPNFIPQKSDFDENRLSKVLEGMND